MYMIELHYDVIINVQRRDVNSSFNVTWIPDGVALTSCICVLIFENLTTAGYKGGNDNLITLVSILKTV